MRKVARMVARMAGGRECDLLDVGCGPGTLQYLMRRMCITTASTYRFLSPPRTFSRQDIVESPIDFRGMKFDFVVAQGIIEYVGSTSPRSSPRSPTCSRSGKFVLTYQNFDHRQREVYWPYSNVQRPADFRKDLARFFRIERSFPASHNWNHSQPTRRLMKASQAHLNVNIPVISPILAVDYLYVVPRSPSSIG